MGVIYKLEKRRILPRWRIVANESPSLGLTNQPLLGTGAALTKQDVVQLEEAWRRHRTLPYAADLLTSAQVLGIDSMYAEVAKSIVEQAQPTSLISKLARRTLQGVGYASEPGEQDTLSNRTNEHELAIGRLRRLLKIEGLNPVAYIEIALHYLVLGESVKAQNSVLSALSIDKDSRYVVRSAARYFHHVKNSEYAIRILQHSDRSKRDPWIMASEIAFASLLGRHSRIAKKALQIVDEGVYFDHHITELASSLGTLEMENGKMKNARRLAAISMRMPNDNSLAQALWNREAFDIPQLRFENMMIPMSWEAKAHLEYQNENFEKAVRHLRLWLTDEPFSVRPIQLLSYLHGSILQRWSESITIIRQAQKIHNNDIVLQNNLVYDYLMMNDIEGAEREIPKLIALMESMPDERKAVASATWGLFMFRKGHIEQGRTLYRQAIRAIGNTNDYLRAVAVANYAREEILADVNSEHAKAALDMERRYAQSRAEYDVRQLVLRNSLLLRRLN